MPNFHVIIPAAGFGRRMGSKIPKQYLLLAGRPLIHHTLDVFAACARIDSITLVLSPDDNLWDAVDLSANDKVRSLKLKVQRCGGATRAATVLSALQSMQGQVAADAWILVHDAARPGLTLALLNHLLDTLQNDPVGGLLAIPLADTLKRADREQRVAHTESRESLWQAQTPQMFRYDLLKRALQEAGGAPTDEAQAIEALGLQPKLVSGELRNLKITYAQDLALVEAILNADLYKRD